MTSTPKCHENLEIAKTANSDNRLQTLVQTFKYSSEGNAAELEQSYHGRKTRVWECTSAPRQIKILRVMNNFLFNQTEVENIRTILYSDGIAIFSGKKNNEGMLGIAEVKFLNTEDYTNLKFEGAIEFDQSSGNSNLHPTELSETKIQDVNYILNDNELFRVHPFTYPAQPGQSPNIIYTLEIREPHPGMKSDEDKEGTRFQTLIRCNELKRSLPKEVRNDVMRPKVIILQSKGVERKVLPHTITKLKNYFDDIKQKIWECKVLPQGTATLYRVQTRMKSKQDEKIREIFYQNGVKIHEDYNDRRHLIEITSYFEKTSKNGKPAFIPVKFEGLVILPFDDLKNKFMDYEGNFHNHLDEPIFQFSPLSKETGVSYLVQSEFTTTIDNSAGEIIVTCVKYSDENTKPRTMQPRILVKKINRNDHENGKWHEVDRKTNNDGILYESYEMWSCYYKEYHFLRVVNKMIMEDNVRVYHQDGVEVQRLILLNGKEFIQIKHERFLKETQGYVDKIKYIGRLQLEIQTLPGLEKMLSSPPFNIQVLGKECYVYTTANLRAMGYRTYPEDDKTKYNPRVAEYIDQKLYILTQDEFDEIFTITSVRTWFCTDNTARKNRKICWSFLFKQK
ncbi:uncharacterized protein LOC111055992 [Nilaparvata lugens]|uniref:uncharacterized protein LOC111055992 n=1 Tax=Nilaparvata lugens TaxID=108931 RepID=UPI00193CF2A8|nr:uncharacterized protein LOC111055992 [Nilaparvata lugens]